MLGVYTVTFCEEKESWMSIVESQENLTNSQLHVYHDWWKIFFACHFLKWKNKYFFRNMVDIVEKSNFPKGDVLFRTKLKTKFHRPISTSNPPNKVTGQEVNSKRLWYFDFLMCFTILVGFKNFQTAAAGLSLARFAEKISFSKSKTGRSFCLR